MPFILTLFQVLGERWRLAVAIFTLLALGVVAGIFAKSQYYESSAKILVNFDNRQISLSRADAPTYAPSLLAADAMTTVSEVLDSREMVERLVDRMGPEAFVNPPSANPYVRMINQTISRTKDAVMQALTRASLVEKTSARDALIARIQKGLSVFPVRQSLVIEISFEWANPTVPPAVMKELVKLYTERVDELNAQTVEEALLATQAEQAAQKLASVQAQLNALRASTGIVDPAQSRQFLTDRIQKLGLLLTADAADGGSGASDGAAGDGALGGEISDLRRQLADLRIERAGALADVTPDSPKIVAIDARITAAQSEIATLRQTIAGSVAGYRTALSKVLDAEPKFNALMREMELSNEAYHTYSQAAADRRMGRMQESALNIREIDAPGDRGFLTGPSRLTLLLVGLAFSALAACFAVLLLDRLRKPARAAELIPANNPVFRRSVTPLYLDPVMHAPRKDRAVGDDLQSRPHRRVLPGDGVTKP